MPNLQSIYKHEELRAVLLRVRLSDGRLVPMKLFD